jgi:diacylglycerol kinase family enzyme
MVNERETLMARGWPKKLALYSASFKAFTRFPNLTVRVSSDSIKLAVRTPLVFVGNNEYEFSGWEAGTRAGLVQGALHVCIVNNPGRAGLLRMAVRALVGRVNDAPELHMTQATWAQVDTFRKRVRVALDGEVVRLMSPLRYTTRPGALRVLVPKPG